MISFNIEPRSRKWGYRLIFIIIFVFINTLTIGADKASKGSVYHQLEGNKPDYELFEKAYIGYIDLKLNGLLPLSKNILSIIDFRKPSDQKRMWVIDLDAKIVLYNTYVAHGENSGKKYAIDFSNRVGSHQSSLGFYVTQETYYGKNGLSLKLMGLEGEFNSNARNRYIVLHGADYATQEYLDENGEIGTSEGCPAIPKDISSEVIHLTKEGTCLFMYFPDSHYLERSSYITNFSDL